MEYLSSVDIMNNLKQGAKDYDSVWPANSIWGSPVGLELYYDGVLDDMLNKNTAITAEDLNIPNYKKR